MKKNTKKDKMLKALRDSLGNISIACKATGISRMTHYLWAQEDADYKAEVDSILDEQGDFVESKLMKRIINEDTTAIIFYCKTKLKDRGFTERNEYQHSGDMVINLETSDGKEI